MSRARGEGTFYQNSRGQWVGRTPDGSRVKRNDRGEAHKAWQEAMERHRAGARSKANPSVNDLWDALVELKAQQGKRQTTIDWYENVRTAHLPAIAGIPAQALTVDDVETWLGDRQKLGSKYLRALKSALGQALDIAMRRDVLTRNVARLAQSPKAP